MTKQQHSSTKSSSTALSRAFQAVVTILRHANDHHIYLAASGIAFNVMLLILPTLLVAVFVIGSLVNEASILVAVEEFVRVSMPFGERFDGVLHSIEAELLDAVANYEKAGWIGIPVLVWISLALFNSVRTALSAVFGMREKGSFLWYMFKDVMLLCVFLLALGVVNVFPLWLSEVVKWTLDTFPSVDATFVARAAPLLLSKGLMLVFFIIVYRFAPNRQPSVRVVLTSAVVYLLLWEGVRAGFGWYVVNIATYGALYGIYATVAAAAFWLYYTALALLFSGEIAAYLVRRTRVGTTKGHYVVDDRD
jgi:membrane protein